MDSKLAHHRLEQLLAKELEPSGTMTAQCPDCDPGSIEISETYDTVMPGTTTTINGLPTETFEQILLHLPLPDLLRLQCISKYWQETIQSSHLCRRALFLEMSKKHRYKHLLVVAPNPKDKRTTDPEKYTKPVINPFMNKYRNRPHGSWKHKGFVDFDGSEHYSAFNRPEASWRKMIVMQPNMAAMSFNVDADLCYTDDAKPEKIKPAAYMIGLTMDDVVNGLRREFARNPDMPKGWQVRISHNREVGTTVRRETTRKEVAEWDWDCQFMMEEVGIGDSGWEVLRKLEVAERGLLRMYWAGARAADCRAEKVIGREEYGYVWIYAFREPCVSSTGLGPILRDTRRRGNLKGFTKGSNRARTIKDLSRCSNITNDTVTVTPPIEITKATQPLYARVPRV